MKRAFTVLLFGLVVLSCTDLDAPIYEKVEDFWQTPQQIEQGMAQAYVQLRTCVPTAWGGLPNVYNLHEMSSDEVIVPVRGGDWNDGTIWEELWKHTWTANSLAVSDGWKFVYNGIDGINSILESLENIPKPPENIDALIAEMRVLRAFYYFQALDLYGNVPIVEKTRLNADEVRTNSREEVFNYVEKEIKSSLPHLSKAVDTKTYGRATQWFALALLAKLYLNADVYIGSSRYTECMAACKEIINSGHFALEPDFFTNFKIDNERSRENIFSIPFDRQSGMDFFLVQLFSLHYNSPATFGLEMFIGVNGPCSTAEYLSIFDNQDIRKKMFLVGQQYVDQIEDEDHLQYDNLGNLLIFDPVITSFSIKPPKTETAGARCAKWEFNKSGWGNMSNDFAVYRLADIILMKAEAEFRNGDAATALITINQTVGGVSIRSRTGLPDFSASEMNLDGLLAERARELSWEGHRRNDLIRFGHFKDERVPEKKISEDFRTLFPIPQAEIDKNIYLQQNPGY